MLGYRRRRRTRCRITELACSVVMSQADMITDPVSSEGFFRDWRTPTRSDGRAGVITHHRRVAMAARRSYASEGDLTTGDNEDRAPRAWVAGHVNKGTSLHVPPLPAPLPPKTPQKLGHVDEGEAARHHDKRR